MHLLYKSCMDSFGAGLKMEFIMLWAIELPIPNENPCFIVSIIEGAGIVDLGAGAEWVEGAGAGLEFVCFADRGII